MIRIEINALETKGGLYLLNGEIFSGIGYEVSEPYVVAAYQFEQGQRSAKLDSTLVPGQKVSGIIADFVEPHEENYDGEPASFQGQPYSGLAYEFRDHHCVSEELYVDGAVKRSISWYLSGDTAAYEIWNDEVTQDIAWFANGQLKFVEYAQKDGFRMGLRFNEQGLITSIDLSGDYFDRLKALQEKLKLNYLDRDYIQYQLSVDESVFMTGDGIHDELLRSIFGSGGLSRARSIHLFYTSVSGEGIDLLSRLENLEHLIVESEKDRNVKDALIRLKQQKPNLKIELNRAPLPSRL